ncbi:MAG: zinc-dependent metalloprotease family protein, partial [bacterium]|nr:zinc-dependent metalloprotease family protein [bacterium]
RTEWLANQANVKRDLVQLFTGKDLVGSAVGIAFSDPGVCSTYYGYSIVQSRYTTAMAYRVADSAHEIGHNCTLYHCNDDEFICRIMCASIGGCSCALHSFGPLSTARLRSYLAGVACLGATEIEFPHATLPFTDNFTAVNLDPAKWTAADNAYPSSGRLQIAHGGGWSPEFYLGTARTLPITLAGRADVSYKVRPLGVIAGQRLWVEYFDTATGTWIMLNNIQAPGGTPADYTTYTHTTPPEAAGDLFSLRFSAYGNQGSSSTDWLVDDVAITASTVDVPAAPATALLRGARPNPFNPRTAVEVALDRRRHLLLRVFDVTGRELAVLAQGDFDAGGHVFVWDGEEIGGRAVPSGTYVVRLESGEIRESRLVSLVR